MGLLDRIKSSYIYTHWKVGRYTKRRRSLVPEFDQRPADFYTRNYRDGEYLHQTVQRQRMSYGVQAGPTTRNKLQIENGLGGLIPEDAPWEDFKPSYRFGDDDSGSFPASPMTWTSDMDSPPATPTTPRVDASGFYRGSMYGAPVGLEAAMVMYSAESAKGATKLDDESIQHRLDAEFQQTAISKRERDRRRCTVSGDEIRCSEMYNMAW